MVIPLGRYSARPPGLPGRGPRILYALRRRYAPFEGFDLSPELGTHDAILRPPPRGSNPAAFAASVSNHGSVDPSPRAIGVGSGA